jgi:uncharacterized protein with LGFP repeats
LDTFLRYTRPTRLAAVGAASATALTLLVGVAPAAVAEASCADDAVGDSSGDDLLEQCVSAADGVVLLDITLAGGGTVASGARTVAFAVTEPLFGSEVHYVVLAEAGQATARFRADEPGRDPVCSAAPTTDTAVRYTVSFPGWCFPRSTRLTSNATVTTSAGPDVGDSTTAAVPVVLDAVDRHYSDLGGPRSSLGMPAGPTIAGQLGTTLRRRFANGLISQSDAVSSLAFDVVGPRYALYQRMGEEAGILGRPKSGEYPNWNRDGVTNRFERGTIMTGNNTGTHEVHGSIQDVYLFLEPNFPERGVLGLPTTDELGTPDGVGRYNHFEGGSVYSTPSFGAHRVVGVMRDKWAGLGWERGPLGYPTQGSSYTFDSVDYTVFERGAVFSSADGVRAVYGGIAAAWRRLGAERGLLGIPITDETSTPDGWGRFNHFTGGSVYSTPTHGAWAVYGAIRQKWAQAGWERGPLGYPVTDELGTPDGQGRFNHFQYGSVYSTSTTGAHEVRGAIRSAWSALRWETGPLGYPVTGETITPDGVGRYNHFQRGSVYWSPTTGAHGVYGAILQRWAQLGWERSSLGYPLSRERDAPGGREQYFQGGRLVWNASTGAVTIVR